MTGAVAPPLRGGCHCGRVRFDADIDASGAPARAGLQLHDLPHGRVPAPDRAGVAVPPADRCGRHGRVPVQYRCGPASVLPSLRHQEFLRAAQQSGWLQLNARCLDGIEPDALEIVPFDDNDRDAATAAIEHLSKD